MPFTSHTQKLAAPTLAPSNKHTICARAAEQLLVNVAPYINMEEGDLIELFWDGCYVSSRQLSNSDVGHPVSLRVPESFIQNGTARLYYRVMHIGSTPLFPHNLKYWSNLTAPAASLSEKKTKGSPP